jgi:hypothetical protein
MFDGSDLDAGAKIDAVHGDAQRRLVEDGRAAADQPQAQPAGVVGVQVGLTLPSGLEGRGPYRRRAKPTTSETIAIKRKLHMP